MPKATPGVPYIIVPGDTLSGIAKQAYGEGRRWREIWQANQFVLRSGDPNLIFPGETITIPKIPELEGQKSIDLPGKASDDFTIVIDNTELVVTSARAIRTMDTAADAWTATVVYNVENEALTKLLQPYKYNSAKVYVGGRLIITGRLYDISIEVSPDEIRKDLEGFSNTIDIVDSNMPKPPYEFRNVTLDQIAKSLAEPFQIPVIFEGDPGGQFKRVTIEKTEKVFEFLAKLAKQRQLLVTSTNKGELLFTRANTRSKPIGSLTVGLPPLNTASGKFAGRKRFKGTKALSKRRGQKTKFAVSKDEVVPVSRFKTFSADDTTSGDIQKAADWDRSKQVGESLGLTLPVSNWYGPNGNLWTENTIVTLKSSALYTPDGFNFIIRAVEFNFNSDGRTAQLSLVPPQVYTGEIVDEPWIL
jgi:prophage tail gpP-like protein